MCGISPRRASRDGRPLVTYMNHCSMLDEPLIMACLVPYDIMVSGRHTGCSGLCKLRCVACCSYSCHMRQCAAGPEALAVGHLHGRRLLFQAAPRDTLRVDQGYPRAGRLPFQLERTTFVCETVVLARLSCSAAARFTRKALPPFSERSTMATGFTSFQKVRVLLPRCPGCV